MIGVSSAAPAPTSAPAPPSQANIAGVGAAVTMAKTGTGSYAGPRFRPPRVQYRFMPDYPADAFHAHKQGSVDVIVDVPDTGGFASEAHVYQSSGMQSLDAAAVDAVLKWKFKSAESNGNPTRAQAIVTIDWIIGPNTREHIGGGTYAAKPSRVDVMHQLDCLRVGIGSSPELCKRVPRR